MPRSEFIHLHLHTQYSLLDGACRISDLLGLAKQYKMDSLTITDHGNMFGAVDFYMEAQRAGIKPIIGCETYVAPGSRKDKGSSGIDEASYHLIMLAKDEIGYHNLMKLVSVGYLEGFYYRPRIDKEILSQHSKGLICLTACLKGEIPQLIQQRRFNDALKAADEYSHILGKDNFYLELQANSIPEQKTVNEGLIKIAKELNLPLVATNDVHYLTKNHARSHEALLCIQTQSTLDDPNRMKFQTNEFYFRSPQEMIEVFKDVPEAIQNTLEIASRCNLELDFSKIHLPRYETPGNEDKEEFLRNLCADGLKRRFNRLTPEINERLEHELKIIKDAGFISYFLIVWDFINYAKKNNIPTGPGRGSAAGSLISYLLGITDINPLKYGLLFERFLNPERKGLPDIDIDFCYERRQEVIEYVTKKYGQENVAQIITFGTMQARAVVRDVGRVMGISYADVDRIAKMIPPDPGISLKQALDSEAELKNMYDNDPQIKELMTIALQLEGLNRHASVHAAGVVIADKPLDNYMPLFKTQEDQITSGYSMSILEKVGLLKVDFLGLRTLTVIQHTVDLIKRVKHIDVHIDDIPLDDKKTFHLLSSAQTEGVFQVESSGMRDLLRKLQPERFEDLIALLALYRPGPIGSGMLDDFIQRKHNRVEIKYPHKKLEPILKETYGIMVYQEQIMQTASVLAGFTLTQADLLRRAMSKKIPEIMEQQRKIFISGCLNNGISESIASKIFDLIEYFSGYGFNKSHSAAYAMISYRTAYLKANYPVEFMTALLTSERDNTDKIVEYINECARMNLKVLPPDINESDALFSVVDDKTIRFGLLAVKNVGLGAIESIINARADSRFKSLHDLCQRIDLRLSNRKVLESLIKCGAMDEFETPRAQMVANLDRLIEFSSKMQKEKLTGQLSFFDVKLTKDIFDNNMINLPQVHEWPEPQLLSFEKEMLGFYVSGHPLARYAGQLKHFVSSSTSTLATHEDGQDVKIVGLIAKVKQTLTRAKQEKMAIVKLEDLEGVVELLIFPQAYQKISRFILPNTVVLVKGRLNLKEDMPKIVVNDMLSFEQIYKSITAVNINLTGMKDTLFESLKELLTNSRGNIPIYLHIDTPSKSKVKLVVGEGFFVEPKEELIRGIEDLIGQDRLTLTI
ncbi:MAG: DNA polymerase III subunit alpha [Candidatus Omnitrophota bacterium]|nr:MAG: DNA polymerase III subunit alpha [Candidatus Omnitrophota bacterium]